ncbi:hypothetical protein MPER_09247 [Moniliophthora perniciosa FA553]|nr:hypothetical protein MPER_09247 [Moniliophthora perniciosa FA553]
MGLSYLRDGRSDGTAQARASRAKPTQIIFSRYWFLVSTVLLEGVLEILHRLGWKSMVELELAVEFTFYDLTLLPRHWSNTAEPATVIPGYSLHVSPNCWRCYSFGLEEFNTGLQFMVP